MIKKVIHVLFLVTSIYAMGQGHRCKEDLFPKKQANGLYGYVNLFGEWRVNPIYTKVFPFNGEVAVVLKGLKYGVINCESDIILRPDYDRIKPFIYNKSWVKKDGKWGLVNDEGSFLTEIKYDSVEDVSRYSPFSWVQIDNKWGLYSKEKPGFIHQPTFVQYQSLSDSTSLVRVSDKAGIISHNNPQYLIKPELTGVKKIAPYVMTAKKEEKTGLISDFGSILLGFEYDSISAFNKYRLKVIKNDKEGMFTTRGKILAPLEYDKIYSYSNGAFRMIKNKSYGFLSIQGKVEIPAMYTYASDFEKGRAIVYQNGQANLINHHNEKLLEKGVYSEIYRNSKENYFVAVTKEQQYFMNDSLELSKDISFDSIYVNDSPATVRVLKEGSLYYYNFTDKRYLTSDAFDDGDDFYLKHAKVMRDNKFGVINTEGNIVFPVRFDSVKFDFFKGKLAVFGYEDDMVSLKVPELNLHIENDHQEIVLTDQPLIKLKKNDLWGVIDDNKKLVIPFEYEKISMASPKWEQTHWPAVVYDGRRYGLLNKEGKEIISVKEKLLEYRYPGYYVAGKEGKVTLLDDNGRSLLQEDYEDIGHFNERLLPVKNNNQWGYIDMKERVKIEYQFEKAYPFFSYVAIASKNGKYGIIDRRGDWKVPPEYNLKEHTTEKRILEKGEQQFKVVVDENTYEVTLVPLGQ